METPVFTLHRYFETKREMEYYEFLVGPGVTPFPNEIMNNRPDSAYSEAARLIVESGTVRYMPNGSCPTADNGVLLTDETFSERELAKINLYADEPTLVRVLIFTYRK